MNRRGLMGMVAALALAAFAGVWAEGRGREGQGGLCLLREASARQPVCCCPACCVRLRTAKARSRHAMLLEETAEPRRPHVCLLRRCVLPGLRRRPGSGKAATRPLLTRPRRRSPPPSANLRHGRPRCQRGTAASLARRSDNFTRERPASGEAAPPRFYRF